MELILESFYVLNGLHKLNTRVPGGSISFVLIMMLHITSVLISCMHYKDSKTKTIQTNKIATTYILYVTCASYHVDGLLYLFCYHYSYEHESV